MSPLPHIYGPATIDPETTFGKNVTVWQYASILSGTEIGDDSVVGSCCWVGRGCKIGRGVHLNHGVFVPHGTIIEDFAFLGPGVILTDDKHPVAGNKKYTAQPPIIRSWASIGAGAVILPGVTIGAGAMIGAGAVVTHDVLPSDLAMGVPARTRVAA